MEISRLISWKCPWDLCGASRLPSKLFRIRVHVEGSDRLMSFPIVLYGGDLRYRQQKVCREADALSPREMNRKGMTYHCWCGKPLNQTARTPFCIPLHLFKDLDKDECE
eukprot:1160237-Pelagomonas_calceolata.AAC.13